MKSATAFLAALVIGLSAAACSQTDSGVTTKVKAKFTQDDIVKANDINVTTRDGVVTLSGEVDTMQARQQALRLARETEGVTDVVDDLRVEVAATSGDDVDFDVDVDADVERGARQAGKAVEKGVRETGEAVRDAGKGIRDSVTDRDRDSDEDGK